MLRADDCALHLRLELPGPHTQYDSTHWSPCSSYVAVVNLVPEGGRQRVLCLWVAGVRSGALLHALSNLSRSISGIWGWVRAGKNEMPRLILTAYPSKGAPGAHRVLYLQLPASCPESTTGSGVPAAVHQTDGQALVTYARDYPHVEDFAAAQQTPTAYFATSQGGQFLAVIRGEGLSAWGVQVLRALNGRQHVSWSAPIGPVQENVYERFYITYSKDSRCLTVGVSAIREPFSVSYLLTFNG